MKDIELRIEGNSVSAKYYSEVFQMRFGKDPEIEPNEEALLKALDFLLYMISKKHRGNYHDIRRIQWSHNGLNVEYQKHFFTSLHELLLFILSK